MSAMVQNANKVYNLIQLKERKDEIVFNYIDTTPKWDIAYESLNELLKRTVEYFKNYVSESDEQLPKDNTLWTLFLDVSSKLLYFHTLAYYHMNLQQNEDVKESVLELYITAANCIPNVQKIANAEFLNEIARSYEEIQLFNGKEGEFERVILQQDNSLRTSFEFFKKYTENLDMN